jgi:transposase-like protein
VHHQACVVGAVEVRTRKDAEERTAKWKDSHEGGIPSKKLVYAGRLRLQVVSGIPSKLEMLANPLTTGRGAEQLCGFVQGNVTAGSTVRTDGWVAYKGLPELGYPHESLAINGDPDKCESHLPMIHLVFSNLKTWLLGTHHGVSQQHLQAYLDEYVFRFNRRFYPMTAFNSVLGLAVKTVPPTYAELYSGEWTRAA